VIVKNCKQKNVGKIVVLYIVEKKVRLSMADINCLVTTFQHS